MSDLSCWTVDQGQAEGLRLSEHQPVPAVSDQHQAGRGGDRVPGESIPVVQGRSSESKPDWMELNNHPGFDC